MDNTQHNIKIYEMISISAMERQTEKYNKSKIDKKLNKNNK